MLEGQHFEPNGRLAHFIRVASDLDQVEIGFAIDTLIARLDDAAGDPDLEDGSDDEPAGDEKDASFPEWTDRRRGRIEGAIAADHSALWNEDEEDDDPGEEDGCERDANGSEEDFMAHDHDGPGCPVADSDMAAWPERLGQSGNVAGGLAGEWWCEDAEPWRVAPHWHAIAIPANDTVPA